MNDSYNFHSDMNLPFLIAIGQVFQNRVLDEGKSQRRIIPY